VLAMVGMFLYYFSIQTIMFFSFLYKYEVSYFRLINNDQKITISSISSVPMFFMLVSAIAALILLKFQQICGYRNIFLMSLFISVLNNLLISYTHNFKWFVFLKALGGISTAITFVLPLYCVWRYFKELNKPVIGGFMGSF
jgi:predicted MFS family arabinose efflux permease